jgi:hypothetical protein
MMSQTYNTHNEATLKIEFSNKGPSIKMRSKSIDFITIETEYLHDSMRQLFVYLDFLA